MKYFIEPMALNKYINKVFMLGVTTVLATQLCFATGQSASDAAITLSIDPICKHYLNGTYTKRVQFQTDTPEISFRYIPGVKEYDGQLAISSPLYVYANAVNKHESNLKLADIKINKSPKDMAFGIKVGKVNPAFEIFNIRVNQQNISLYLQNKKVDHFDLSGLHCDVTVSYTHLTLPTIYSV